MKYLNIKIFIIAAEKLRFVFFFYNFKIDKND